MTVEPLLRDAGINDAAALAGLVTQLGYPCGIQEVTARLTALHAADQGVLVAEVNRAVVGLVHVQRLATLVLDDAAEIGALVVDGKWRGQGIGRALLDAAAGWATQRGCRALYVRTNIVRQRAHGFYLRNGFQQVKTSLTLLKEL